MDIIFGMHTPNNAQTSVANSYMRNFMNNWSFVNVIRIVDVAQSRTMGNDARCTCYQFLSFYCT